jgi:uncharacterized repeat protein (TIGR04076 family)
MLAPPNNSMERKSSAGCARLGLRCAAPHLGQTLACFARGVCPGGGSAHLAPRYAHNLGTRSDLDGIQGEEFVIDPSVVPEDFCAHCAWAWADIRKGILTVAMGANMPGIRQPGTVITDCTDWLRPVIFKVERMDSA